MVRARRGTLSPLPTYARPGTLVAEKRAVWRGSEASTVASLFRIRHGRIVGISSFDSLEAALAAADLSEADLLAG